MGFRRFQIWAVVAFLWAAAQPALAEEPPPTRRDPVVAAALENITADGLASHVQQLQSYQTRYSYMPGCDEARDYLYQTLLSLGYRVRLQPFKAARLEKSCWGRAAASAWVLTPGSTLFYSDDAGTSWARQVPGAPGHLYDVCFVDDLVGYVCSTECTVAKTEDGGKTWHNVAVKKSSEDILRAVFFYDRDVGWTACGEGEAAVCYRTDDGGERWTPQPLPPYGCPHLFAFADPEAGWAVPNSLSAEVLYRTEDGGATWVAQPFPTPPAEVRSFVALSGDVAWAAYGGPRLLHTDDGGRTWEYVGMDNPAVLTTVGFADATTGYAAGDNVLYKTQNGGQTWSRLAGAPPVFWGHLSFGDADRGLLIDLFGRELYYTADGGGSFENITSRLDVFWENVVAERLGEGAPEEIVVLGAHYDSASDRPAAAAPGANANASGVGCVLAAAAAFRNLPLDRTLRIVLFSGGEQSYVGSRAFVAEAAAADEKLLASVILDQVGYDEEAGKRDDGIVRLDGRSMWLGDYVGAVGMLYEEELQFDYHLNGGTGDHVPFWEGTFEAVGLFEGGPGSTPDPVYPYYHTTQDTADKLAFPLAARLGRVAAATVAHLVRSDYIGVDDPTAAAGTKPRRRPLAVYPNPYRPGSGAALTFDGVSSPATVAVYDLAGRRVAGWEVPAGRDRTTWRPGDAGVSPAPGVYFYRVAGRDQREAGKVVLLGP
ncbi:MAG: M28 family peptidase [Candidatus Coatesbacteria bacterium]|nr:MAG: M28 family peptidase [Candidatus Coatesbacteria bacterium]